MKLLKLNQQELREANRLRKFLNTISSEMGFSDHPKNIYTKNIKNSEYKSWSFIPNRDMVDDLLRIKKTLWKKTKQWPKFLDLGCGVGNIVGLAHSLGFSAKGVELDDELPKIFNPYSIINDDILDFDITEINPDVVYFYMPIQDRKVMQKVFNNTAKNLKKGGIILFYTDGCGFYPKYSSGLKIPKCLESFEYYNHIFYKK